MPAGLPDPAVLARMANEFFTALGEGEPSTAAPPPAAAPATSSSAAIRQPATLPAFSFLKDVRPLFVEPEAEPPNPNPFVQPFGEFIPSEWEGAALPSQVAEIPQPPMPTVPGALGNWDSSALPTFSFLEEARPLFSPSPTVPGPVPSSNALPVPNLSPYPFDAEIIRRDFPILRERVNGRPLVWLDNAATTQKPQSVIDRLSYFYEHENSNVHSRRA